MSVTSLKKESALKHGLMNIGSAQQDWGGGGVE
jgi:hypothetical protein